MARKSAVRVTPSTGNVFRDLGFSKEESEHLLVRADLLIQVQKAIAARGLKQAEAARLLRVTQPRVSDLLRGRIDLFSCRSPESDAGPWLILWLIAGQDNSCWLRSSSRFDLSR